MKNRIAVGLILIILIISCSKPQFIADKDYYRLMKSDLQAKKDIIAREGEFPDFKNIGSLSPHEVQAMEFLYAYMPLGDLVDYSPEFYLQNVRASFDARREMEWGRRVPEDLFRHFVLPVRVNNENLDSARMVFYPELKGRVKELSMYNAILEVNHWCHEKVVYQPSDARTSSPLASVRNAYGRCGEESTFTVAALRAVGIPARQVYTPRWAHTDDNHAWVEAWADGQWYYLGACEPSPVLNNGWFDAPAKRALLLHTKVFGRYSGPEEVMQMNRCFTEINVTSNYAPVAKATIKVCDKDGNAIPKAYVEFGIYNYAEFFPVLTTQTDSNGNASITAGLGDISVWASKNGQWGLEVISVNDSLENIVTLRFSEEDAAIHDFDIVPPVEVKVENSFSVEMAENTKFRMLHADSLRERYVSSFISEADAYALANRLGLDEQKVLQFLKASRGNWREILSFLEQTEPSRRSLALDLLSELSQKDLRDTPASVMANHLTNVNDEESPLFQKYILNPRVAFELLTPYRLWLSENIPPSIREEAAVNPKVLVDWVSKFKTLDEYNPLRIPISPKGVVTLGVTDEASKAILFVAACRSLGIPARVEEVTRQVQYYHQSAWYNANLNEADQKQDAQRAKGHVRLRYNPAGTIPDPAYDSHFTIAKIEDGRLRRLNFRNTEGSEGTVTLSSGFAMPVGLEEGNYLVISGSRLASGKVLAHVEAFSVVPGKTVDVNLILRNNIKAIQVVGSINPEALFTPVGSSLPQSVISNTGRGYFAIAMLGAGHEPSNHAARDFVRFRSELEGWGRPILLIFKDESQLLRFQKDGFGQLPSNVAFGFDSNQAIQSMIVNSMNIPADVQLPIVLIADSFGRVVFFSQGYSIGLANQMLSVIGGL